MSLVVLIGAMGAGKTTVGGLLAERLGVDFADTDRLIEEAEGRSVSDIFITDGEDYFRDVERRVVADAIANRDGVLALGGGSVLDVATQTDLGSHVVVYLKVGLADAVKRVGLGTGRPLLFGNVRSRVQALLAERDPIYEAIATHSIDTNGRTPEEIVDDIAARLKDG